MRKKKIFWFFITLLLVFFITPFVYADTGPKPHAEYTFKNLEESNYIVAVIYKKEIYGPHINYKDSNDKRIYDLLKLLDDKVDIPDGYFLLDIASLYENTTGFTYKTGYWYPTNEYKILLYDVLNEKAYFSQEINNYAFNSYYHYDFSNFNLDEFILVSEGKKFVALNIVGFVFRLLITIAIELLIAIPFKFDKKSIKIIILTNFITQVLLNIILTVGYINSGKNIYVWFFYLLVEFIILLIEMVIYLATCRLKSNNRILIPTYTVLANISSFLLSFLVWLIPWM